MKTRFQLLALAIGAFGIGMTEFSPMGMLTIIAKGVSVSIPQAGLLMSAYALGVLLGVPLMTLLLTNIKKRNALLILMGIFTIGNILATISPNYSTLMISRIITSLTHGAFFGFGGIVAASIIVPEKQASAIASMFLGMTIANIGGVPLATYIGENIGWRSSFFLIALIGILAIIFIRLAIPININNKSKPNFKEEIRTLTQKEVLIALFMTALSSGAMFTIYTYIYPLAKNLTNASSEFIIILLILIGLGFTIGTYISGKFATKSLSLVLKLSLSLLTITLLIIPIIFSNKIMAMISIFIYGATYFATVPPLQLGIMRAAANAPELSSPINIGSFNLGNAIGAALGGLVRVLLVQL